MEKKWSRQTAKKFRDKKCWQLSPPLHSFCVSPVSGRTSYSRKSTKNLEWEMNLIIRTPRVTTWMGFFHPILGIIMERMCGLDRENSVDKGNYKNLIKKLRRQEVVILLIHWIFIHEPREHREFMSSKSLDFGLKWLYSFSLTQVFNLSLVTDIRLNLYFKLNALCNLCTISNSAINESYRVVLLMSWQVW